MPLYAIHSLDDPRLGPYRNLKERELARDGGRFIAEGESVVRRLLASATPVESLLLSERRVSEIAPICPLNVPIFAAPNEIIRQTLGFKFHSGVMACGIRPPSPSLRSIIPPLPKPVLLTVCEEIANSDNMGSMIRISAAFGATAMILGERCCDPYFRQSVRVSMGAIFALPIVRSADLFADLEVMQELGIARMAAVVDEDAEPLDSVRPISRVAVLFGNEAQGLTAEVIKRCDRRVTIPMRLGTDSLNVAVSAAVFLYQLTAKTSPPI